MHSRGPNLSHKVGVLGIFEKSLNKKCLVLTSNLDWKDVKGPVQFHEKLKPGEALESAWFGDIRLIGMYFLGDSSHMYIV